MATEMAPSKLQEGIVVVEPFGEAPFKPQRGHWCNRVYSTKACLEGQWRPEQKGHTADLDSSCWAFGTACRVRLSGLCGALEVANHQIAFFRGALSSPDLFLELWLWSQRALYCRASWLRARASELVWKGPT